MLSGMIHHLNEYITIFPIYKGAVIYLAPLGVIFLPAAKEVLFALLTVILYSP